ncbi:polyunsaturated fatty acid 5-lipoxygenase-like isoform X1 [Hydractinia symbiolongicarpus]|uniref:polyunsaturated fatty acid 5-lipoxygenase-like isoform X1 n=1 Tax=Hydractinia symbiolongicarpus TaxID=13093 RepID=UPI00254C61AD|nr:polyunsaturated fatty acid 5-lipoxygenase-like isoform X1 [Hydractinia symbiolongicarpus]
MEQARMLWLFAGLAFLANLYSCNSIEGLDFAELHELSGNDDFHHDEREFTEIVMDHNKCYLPRPCKISLPQHTTSKKCLMKRAFDTIKARFWYKITDETQQSTINFPFKFIPFLNQTNNSIAFYYAIDKFESKYFILYLTWVKTMGVVLEKMNKAFALAPFFTIKEYEIVHQSFEAAIKSLRVPQHFNSPQSDPSHTSFISNKKWEDDDTFSQYVLTMQCPWTLRKVTKRGKVGLQFSKLVKQLNPVFDFTAALSQAYGRRITLYQAARQQRLYVLYNEEHNGMPTFEDILDKNPNDTRTLINVTSPITLFIRNRRRQLKVVAIQWDYLPSSDVFTPSSPKAQWLSARGMALQAHQDVCQFKHHLGHVHFVYTIFCLAFRRHFSTLHPLYDVLKFHCEGTTPHISTAYPALSFPQSYGHQYFAVSHIGVANLSTQAYQERRYGMFDFETLMKKRGLNDRLLRYNPFRDDGKVIWRELKSFAYRLVKMYYRRDLDVKMDRELQSFANEVSADGTGQDGGKGKFTGFPSSFCSRHQLSLFITRFLWYNIIHVTVNYAISPTYLPMMPVKLYNDTAPNAAGKYAHFLPDSRVTVGATHFGDTLSHFRANRIMDYYDRVNDKKLRYLVKRTYNRFNSCIQRSLQRRNARRKAAGYLGMQYLEPKWLTNSVHI